MVNQERIHIGQMDRRIRFIKKVKTTTETGSERIQDQEVATLWAARKTAGSERVVDEKVVALNVVRYHFRYHPAIAGEQILDLILEDDGVRFEIYGHEILGRKEFIQVKCQAHE